MKLKMFARMLAATIFAAGFSASAFADPVNSFFPGGMGKLVDANGNVVTPGTCLSLTSGTLSGTCSGGAAGTGGSAVRAGQLEMQTPGGGPIITAPYYLTTYAELPGTITGARVSGLSASGANLQFVVHVVHPVAGGTPTDTIVGNLNNVGVCDGEASCSAGTTANATYAAPLYVATKVPNTYAAGDLIYVSYNSVGGIFTNFNLHLDLVQ